MLSYAKSATARHRLNGFKHGKTQMFNYMGHIKWAYFQKKCSVPLRSCCRWKRTETAVHTDPQPLSNQRTLLHSRPHSLVRCRFSALKPPAPICFASAGGLRLTEAVGDDFAWTPVLSARKRGAEQREAKPHTNTHPSRHAHAEKSQTRCYY